MMRTLTGLAVCFAFSFAPLFGAEYFVGLDGDDGASGLSESDAFRTVQKGLDALEPGDILMIGPGEYNEAVKREGLGDDEADTVIRARIPGSVLLRGDVPAPDFQKVPGYRYVYAAPWPEEPQAVLEVDSLVVIEKRVSMANVEFEPGTFYYDGEEEMLYVSTSDMQPPTSHRLRLSVTTEPGLWLVSPRRVTLEGLAATGYYQAKPGWSKYYVWGFRLDHPVQCVVRDCVAYMNAGGIAIWGDGERNVIEDCVVYGNYSQYQGEGGNILRFGGNHDVIRNCYSYRSGHKGMSFYGKGKGPVTHKNNIAWGNSLIDIRIKGHGDEGRAHAENCVALGNLMVHDIEHCLLEQNGYRTSHDYPETNVRHSAYAKTKYHEFADPDNLDFRLQSDSRLRGAGPEGSDVGPYPYEPNIFYVRPDGDDTRDGSSVRLAWKTLGYAAAALKAGDTLYIEPGVYDEDVRFAGKDLDIRGRGREPVVLAGRVALEECRNVTLRLLRFSGDVEVDAGDGVTFENCAFDRFRGRGVASLALRHGVFAAEPSLVECSDLLLSGNLFASGVMVSDSSIAWSDYNAYDRQEQRERMPDRYSLVMRPEIEREKGAPALANADAFAGRGPLGTALGIHTPYRPEPVKWAGPFVHSVSATTANVEWWAALPSVWEVAWGDTPACENTETFQVEGYGGFSLTGLTPGKRYYFTIRSVKPKDNNYNVNVIGEEPNATLTLDTPEHHADPVTYHVAPDGDDRADGRSRDTAWRTVAHAAGQVNAGDTVLVAGGVYPEVVVLRATGAEDRPITIKAAPGEKVLFDGVNRSQCEAFKLNGKRHVNLDGFYFKGHRHAGWSGVFRVVKSEDIRITRCFWDGRGQGNPNLFLYANDSRGVVVKNCVIFNGFYGMYIANADIRIENSVNMRNWITAMNANGADLLRIVQKDCVITDSTPFKVGVWLYEVSRSDTFFDTNNCYYLRLPDEERRMFLFYGDPDVKHLPSLQDRRMSLAEYNEKVRPTNSFTDNPMFAVTKGMEDTREMGQYAPAILADKIYGIRPLDFPDLFTTNPKLIERGIGLEPEAFEDFHFNTEETANAGTAE